MQIPVVRRRMLGVRENSRARPLWGWVDGLYRDLSGDVMYSRRPRAPETREIFSAMVFLAVVGALLVLGAKSGLFSLLTEGRG